MVLYMEEILLVDTYPPPPPQYLLHPDLHEERGEKELPQCPYSSLNAQLDALFSIIFPSAPSIQLRFLRVGISELEIRESFTC